MFPLLLRLPTHKSSQPNLSSEAIRYLAGCRPKGADAVTLFYHIVALLYSPAYGAENAFALRQGWPRIPLPTVEETLLHSAKIGRELSALLDVDMPVTGVTVGTIRSELRDLGSITRESGGTLNPDSGDLDVAAGWGHEGKGGAVMPGKGKLIERAYAAKERESIVACIAALGLPEMQGITLLGDRTFDVYLNNFAYWRIIPLRVWEFTIGGYQVIKKWLSYRERPILGRGLTTDEVRTVTEIARRIAAIILMQPALNANYEAVKKSTYTWPAGTTTGQSFLRTQE